MADTLDARGAALWNDGVPVNLRAAAMDAMAWLDVLMKQAAYIRMPRDDLRRLMACRAALDRQLHRPARSGKFPRGSSGGENAPGDKGGTPA